MPACFAVCGATFASSYLSSSALSLANLTLRSSLVILNSLLGFFAALTLSVKPRHARLSFYYYFIALVTFLTLMKATSSKLRLAFIASNSFSFF